MSKYIQQDNQKLLWDVSQKMPNIRNVFPEMTQQERWFKDVIQYFYEQNKFETLSKHRLENLNKETIKYMINSLKSTVNPVPKKNAKQVSFINQDSNNKPNVTINEYLHITPRSQQSVFEPIDSIHTIESRTGSNNLLEIRQKEYDNMFKREIPIEPNFRELIEDTAIENIEELVQQQLRQRELDIATLSQTSESLSGQPPITENITSIPPKVPEKNNNLTRRLTSSSLKIMEDIHFIDNSNMVELTDTLPQLEINTQMNEMMNLLLELKKDMNELKKIHLQKTQDFPNESSVSENEKSNNGEENG